MKQIILAVALVLAGSATAIAQPGAPPEQPHLRQKQGRQHGQMRGQMRQRLLAQFDHDRDGRLTGREKRAAKKFVMRMRFERRMVAMRRFDANQDGWLSPEEQRAARQAFRDRRRSGGTRTDR